MFDEKINNNITRKDYILAELYGLEARSEHPLAEAVKDYVKSQYPSTMPVRINDFSNATGLGICGTAILPDGSRIKVNAGSGRFMSMLGVNIPETLTRKASSMHGTLIWFSEDGEASAVLAISDQIRNTAKEGIGLLKNMGIDTYILTGDRKESAANVASELGVRGIRAEALPSDKVEFIRSI